MTELREKLNNIVEEKNTKVTPENLRAGAEAFGVQGTFTADADATAEDIANGKTAYVNGEKIVGAMKSDAELISSFASAVDGSLGANTTRLPSSLTSIGNYAFYNCTNLALTELPDSITSIGNYAFDTCTNLPLTKLPKNLKTLGNRAFYKCAKLTITELPEELTSIGEYTFEACTNLQISKLPDSLTSMGSYVFQDCKKITVKEVPATVGVINSYSFRNCESITEMTIKGDITNIYNYSFNGCANLTKFVLPNVTKVVFLSSNNAFDKTPIKSGTGYIYVPDTLVDSFKKANGWITYANQIKGLSELS